jgi:hypothetical protein
VTSTPPAIKITSPGAAAWPPYPTLYEINTWAWLSEVSRKCGKKVSLGSVPPSEWDAIAANGFDSVWLMGVWERSPAGVTIANQNKRLVEEFCSALPGFQPDDNVGSAYCVRRYVADMRLGGAEGLAMARQELAKRGMNLILDFVPNHVAPDHPWATEHPEYFIPGSTEELHDAAPSCIEVQGRVFACGRDPNFPAWQDVLQLNSFEPSLRRAVIETVSDIAKQCDGIRCDMAMLVMNRIFERTWGGRAGIRPATEYWVEVIASIKNRHPHFLFIAEAYWDLEWELQQQGFDFCYDKKLYDRLVQSDAECVRLHLNADLAYQKKLVRFIENHDEPRAASIFAPEKERAVAIAIATLPGMKLFHQGQFEGRRRRLPVFLNKYPAEPTDESLRAFYTRLVQAIDRPAFREGQWSLCDRAGWPDNASFQNLLAWTWEREEERYIIVLNLSDHSAQARIRVRWAGTVGGKCHLVDLISGSKYERDVDQMLSPGLHVDLGPWNFHFLQCLHTI